MGRLPSDRELLRAIYLSYYEAFRSYSDEVMTRSSRIFVPLDLDALAESLGMDPDVLFGRLYYHLNKVHAYTDAQGENNDFFAIRVGSDKHCVNFPYLASVLADLEDRHRQFLTATLIASISMVVSFLSVIIAVFT